MGKKKAVHTHLRPPRPLCYLPHPSLPLHVQVSHVHVPEGKLMFTEVLSAVELERLCRGVWRGPAPGAALVKGVIGALTGLLPGHYLLTHAAGEGSVQLFRAPEGEEGGMPAVSVGPSASMHMRCGRAW